MLCRRRDPMLTLAFSLPASEPGVREAGCQMETTGNVTEVSTPRIDRPAASFPLWDGKD